MKKNVIHTILTTSNEGFTYDEFAEDWELNHEDEELPAEESAEFYAWCQQMSEENFEADLDNIKYCKAYNVPCVVEGGFDGSRYADFYGTQIHKMIPEKHESVYEVIKKILSFRGNFELNATFEDGEINVAQYHHDGVNYFTIKALSKRGIAKKSGEYKPYDFKKLPYLYDLA